jgi:threonine dehydrogenase-like Zn-dependent dehydrogenase
VGQFAIASAWMLGANRVIAIDRVPERLEMAKKHGKAETVNYEEDKDIVEELKELTGGMGPDASIDAVGMEAHGTGLDYAYDRVKQAVRIETDRPTALRHIIQSTRKGGVLSVPGVYGGFVDKFNLGAAFGKGLSWAMGQTHVQKYMRPLLARIQSGEIDPSYIITHTLPIEQAPYAYEIFRKKEDNCIKVVLKP